MARALVQLLTASVLGLATGRGPAGASPGPYNFWPDGELGSASADGQAHPLYYNEQGPLLGLLCVCALMLAAAVSGMAACYHFRAGGADAGSSPGTKGAKRGLAEEPTPNSLDDIQELRRRLLDRLDTLKENEVALRQDGGEEEEAASASADGGPSATAMDYDVLVRKLAQRAAKRVGPALTKGQAVRNVLENRVSSFAGKATSLLWSEVNSAAGSVFQAVEAEEAGLLAEWNQTVDANLPPITSLLGGLLAPVILTMNIWNNITQVMLVLLPCTLLCAWAAASDSQHPCSAIPTLREWVLATAVVGGLLLLARAALLARICVAQQMLRAHSEQMRERLLKVERHDDMELGRSFSELRELFVSHAVALQRALLVEEDMRRSPLQHAVGAGTTVWLVLGLWGLVLVLGWTFVPGLIAFHPGSGSGSYCAAWASVLAARIVCVISMLFLFVNVGAVVSWLSEVLFQQDSCREALLQKCEGLDNDYMLGLPAAQFLARSVLFRGPAEIVSSRLSVALQEKSQLAREFRETQARLEGLRKSLEQKKEAAEMLQRHAEDGPASNTRADTIEESLQQTMDPETWRARGIDAIRRAEGQALAIQAATTEDIERIIEKVTAVSQDFAKSEAFKFAVARVEEARLKGVEHGIVALEELRRSEKVQQALSMGQEVVFQVLDNPALQSAARAGLEHGAAVVEELRQSETVQQALAKGQEVAQQVLESETVQTAARQAQEVAQQVMESEAVQTATRQAQEVVQQVRECEAGRQAKEVADQVLESEVVQSAARQAHEVAEQAQDVVQQVRDSEIARQAQEAVEKGQETARRKRSGGSEIEEEGFDGLLD